jgi:hypothetical protein
MCEIGPFNSLSGILLQKIIVTLSVVILSTPFPGFYEPGEEEPYQATLLSTPFPGFRRVAHHVRTTSRKAFNSLSGILRFLLVHSLTSLSFNSLSGILVYAVSVIFTFAHLSTPFPGFYEPGEEEPYQATLLSTPFPGF